MSISQLGVKNENLHEILLTIKLQNFLTLKKLKEPKEEAIRVCVAIVVIYLDSIEKEKLSEKVVSNKEGVNAEVWKAYSKNSVHLFRAIGDTLNLLQAGSIKSENVAFAKRVVKGLKVDKFAPKNSIDEHVNNMLKFILEFVKFYEDHMSVQLEDFDTFSFLDVYKKGGFLIFDSSVLIGEYAEEEPVQGTGKGRGTRQSSTKEIKKSSSSKFMNPKRDIGLLSVEGKQSENIRVSQEEFEISNKIIPRVYSQAQKNQPKPMARPPANFSQKNITSMKRRTEGTNTIDIDLTNLKVAPHVELEDLSIRNRNDESNNDIMKDSMAPKKELDSPSESVNKINTRKSGDKPAKIKIGSGIKESRLIPPFEKQYNHHNIIDKESRPPTEPSKFISEQGMISEIKISDNESHHHLKDDNTDQDYKSGFNESDLLNIESLKSKNTIERFQSGHLAPHTEDIQTQSLPSPQNLNSYVNQAERPKVIQLNSAEKNDIIYGAHKRGSQNSSVKKNSINETKNKEDKGSLRSSFNNKVKNLYSNRRTKGTTNTGSLGLSSKVSIPDAEQSNELNIRNMATEQTNEMGMTHDRITELDNLDISHVNHQQKAAINGIALYDTEDDGPKISEAVIETNDPYLFEVKTQSNIQKRENSRESSKMSNTRSVHNKNSHKKSSREKSLGYSSKNAKKRVIAEDTDSPNSSTLLARQLPMPDSVKIEDQDEKAHEPVLFYPTNNEMLIIDQSRECIESSNDVNHREEDITEIKIRKTKNKNLKKSFSPLFSIKDPKSHSVQKTRKEPARLRLKSQNTEKKAKINQVHPSDKNFTDFPHKKSLARPSELKEPSKITLLTSKNRAKSTKADMDRKLFNFVNRTEKKSKVERTGSVNTKINQKSKIKVFIENQEERRNFMMKRETLYNKDYKEIMEEQQKIVSMRLEAKKLKSKIDKKAKEVILEEIKNKEDDLIVYTKEFLEKNKIATEDLEKERQKFLREIKDENWKDEKYIKEEAEKEQLEARKKELLYEKKTLETTLELLKESEETEKSLRKEKGLDVKHDRKVKEKEEIKAADLEKETINVKKDLDIALKKHDIKEKRKNWEQELKYYENLLK